MIPPGIFFQLYNIASHLPTYKESDCYSIRISKWWSKFIFAGWPLPASLPQLAGAHIIHLAVARYKDRFAVPVVIFRQALLIEFFIGLLFIVPVPLTEFGPIASRSDKSLTLLFSSITST